MAWNNELPPFLEALLAEEPNVDGVSTGIPEVDEALFILQDQNRANFGRVARDINGLASVVNLLAEAFVRYASEQNRVTNGLIEFPTQFSTSAEVAAGEHTGNIKVSYVQLMYAPSPGGGAGDTPAIQIKHGYGDGIQGQTPRGWFQMANSFAAASTRFLDQIICSRSPSPITSPGYTSADVTAATTVIGRPGAAAGTWVVNGVLAGDQIKLIAGAGIVGAGTATVSANSTAVTGTLSTFTTQGKEGWYFRWTGGGVADTGWHVVDTITSNTVMTVVPAFIAAVAGGAYEFLPYDRTWIDISTVTPGAPDTLTLASPGTEIPVGTTTCEYVIRRPMTDTYATLRYLGSQFTETTIAFY